MKTISVLIATSLFTVSAPVLAQAPASPPPAAPPPAAPPARDAAAPPPEAPKPDRGAFVAGAKVGAAIPLDSLGPMVSGVVEVGYVFPFLKRSFGLLVDVAYTVPTKNGTATDMRVDGSTYNWTITQKELTFSPAVYYRLTMLGRVVPYVGVGPRIYLHQSVVQGSLGPQAMMPNTPISATTEQSTKIGVMVPVGVGIHLGPGELLGEFMFEWGKLDHTATGDSTSMGANVQVGYRFLL
jgi:hypothetical protein